MTGSRGARGRRLHPESTMRHIHHVKSTWHTQTRLIKARRRPWSEASARNPVLTLFYNWWPRGLDLSWLFMLSSGVHGWLLGYEELPWQ